MSCAGNKQLKTPNIDKLVESGIRFDRNYVSQPLCLPFRSSLQTARYPHEIGIFNNGSKIKGNFPFLGNLIAKAGYDCEYFGKWHVGIDPKTAGYSNYDNVGLDDKKTERARAFLLQKHSQPFFLTVSYTNPHNVCQLARDQKLPDGAIDVSPGKLELLPPLPENFDIPENEPTSIREIQKKTPFHYPTADWDRLKWRQYLWGYYRLVEKVDREIGEVLSTLKESGYEKNTIVIFTSDHGEGVAMHHWNQKQILYDQVTKVPLIINWKGVTKKEVYLELVCNALDIPATILDVADVEKPKSMRGNSLIPIVNGKSLEAREYVVSETMFAKGGKSSGTTGRMLRTKKYKYCIYDNGKNREQLFDMENDPGEMNNLAGDSDYFEILNRHRELIAGWAKETNDSDFNYYNQE